MAATGGDIIEATYNHSTLGSGVFYPKSGEDSDIDLGGLRSSDEDSGVDGAGNMIDSMSRKRWSFPMTVSSDMNNNQELEQLNALAESPILADWTFTLVNGVVYGGQGKPVGEIAHKAKDATVSFKVSGGGKLKKI